MASSLDPSAPTPSAPPAESMPTQHSTTFSNSQQSDDDFPTDFEFTVDIHDSPLLEAGTSSSSVNNNPSTSTANRSPQSHATAPSSSTPPANSPTKSPQSPQSPATEDDDDDAKKDDSMFECNICLDTAKEAVVSLCGHLFCWPCLHQWLETRPTRQLCPVCKAAISREKVIPLYGRGSSQQEDPRLKVPPRPAGQRTEPEPQTAFQGFGFGDGGFQMSLGIGAFPFGIFTSTFNFGTNLRTPNMMNTTLSFEDEQFLSKAFLWVTIMFLFWLIFVA